MSTGIEASSLFPPPPSVLLVVQKTTTTLLWQPKSFLLNIILSSWALILQTPPTLQILLAYLIIYKLGSWVANDYQAYLDLGRGGTPSDVWGWWRVTRLRLMAGIDVLQPPHVPPMLEPYRGFLWKVHKRHGIRPVVKGVAPQRQVDQKTPASTFDRLVGMISAVAKANPDCLLLKKSTLEGHTISLKAKRTGPIEIPKTEGEFGHEICHPHRNDGSIHMVMHPEDIRTVIEAGWGERHPLSTSTWYWKVWYHHVRNKRLPVPEYLVLIYAPRDDEEIAVIEKLLQAAIWFKTKKVLDGGLTKKSGKQSPSRVRRRSK